MEIYTIHKLYIGYTDSSETYAEVIGTYANLDEAIKNLHEIVWDYYGNDEEPEPYWQSKECLIQENKDHYLEFNIVHTILIS